MGIVAGMALTGGLAALFALLAVQFRRGRWLHLIAGNNCVTSEEMEAPEQRLLGRRVARAMWATAVMNLFIAAMLAADATGNELAFVACSVGCGASAVVMVAIVAHAMAKGAREGRAQLDSTLDAGTTRSADARIERKQTVIIRFRRCHDPRLCRPSLYAHLNA